jgi:RimJ/RimL family protein N-acetyltransferase
MADQAGNVKPTFRRSGDGTVPNVLAGAHVTLRELTQQQAANLLAADASGDDWAPGYPFSGTLSAADSFATRTPDRMRPGFGMYQIVRNDEQLVVGDIGFHRAPEHGTVEVGFGLIQSARGLGLAKDALRTLCAWALQQDGVDQIVATTTKVNLPSRAVLESCGFRATTGGGEQLTFTLSNRMTP